MKADGEGVKAPMEAFMKNLPSSEMYFKSYMHKQAVQFVVVSPETDFFVSMSVDGIVKFWHRKDKDIEFVKGVNTKDGTFNSYTVSHDGQFVATGSCNGKVSVFSVASLDLVSHFDFGVQEKVVVAFLNDVDTPIYELAVALEGTNSIQILDALEKLEGGASPTILNKFEDIHRASITCMAFLSSYKCMVSCDRDGLIEFWRPDGTVPTFGYAMKFDTNLFTLAGTKTFPISCSASRNGKHFALCCSDWMTRVFDVYTGKLVLTVPDDLGKEDTYGLEEDVWTARIESEKEYRASQTYFSSSFDETGNILMLPSMFGLKFVSIQSGNLQRIIGRVEKQQRFNSVAVLQSKEPMALLTAWDDERVYLFTRNAPESSKRDVFNEKTTKQSQSRHQTKTVKPTNAKWPKVATLHTTMGSIKFEMFADECPLAVENFVTLARRGYYNNIRIHRVVRDFCIQTGDPTGKGYGGESIWGANFEDEFPVNGHKFDKPGMVGMANSGPNSNASQFFITTTATPHLNGKHTCWGQVIDGIENVRQIELVPVDNYHHPLSEVKLVNITFI